jgi:hypothetical protein
MTASGRFLPVSLLLRKKMGLPFLVRFAGEGGLSVWQ